MTERLSVMRSPGRWLQGLHDLIAHVGVDNYPVVEIGTFAGESAKIFAEYASEVFTIDPWVEYPEGTHYGLDVAAARKVFFSEVMANDDANIIKPIQLHSAQAVGLFPRGSIRLLYIDGWHKFTAEDIDIWWDSIMLNGYIAGHDYNDYRFPEIPHGIAERFGAPDAMFQDESWVVKKTQARMDAWERRQQSA